MTTWEERRRSETQATIDYYDRLTLDDARRWHDSRGIACACIGGPSGFTACFCRLHDMQYTALRRAAHIVVKLVDEVARRKP